MLLGSVGLLLSAGAGMFFTVDGLEEFAKPEPPPSADGAAPGGAGRRERPPREERRRKKKKKKKVVKPLSAEELEDFQAEQEARGIVYMSRVPPFMKPEKVRHELAPYGQVLRIYLTPEARSSHLKRKRHKGNSKIKYVDGWIEFADKRDAKMAAQALNAQPFGGKKRSYYHDDLWTLKYLPGFKWRHLTEAATQQRMEKSEKLQTELAQAKKERGWYLAKVEQAKGIRMKEKRLEEGGRLEETAAAAASKKPVRTFRQRQALDEDGEPGRPSGAKRARGGDGSGGAVGKRRGRGEQQDAAEGGREPKAVSASLLSKIFNQRD